MSSVGSCRIATCARYEYRPSAIFRRRAPILSLRPSIWTCRSWTVEHSSGGSILLSWTGNSRATARHYSNSASPPRTATSPAHSEDTLLPQSQVPSQPSTGPGRTINPSATHHSLATFLSHAQRTGLSTSSSVYNGTVYEYVTQETLRRQGFELQRVGGRGDRGVDLVGLWRVPRSRETSGDHEEGKEEEHGRRGGPANYDRDHDLVLRVVVQCKRLVGKHAKIGPNLIRELDGAVRGARLGSLFESIVSRDVDVGNIVDDGGDGIQSTSTSSSYSYSNSPAIGILVGTRPATKGVIESLRRSNRGLVWIMLEEVAAATPLASGMESPIQEQLTTAEAGNGPIDTELPLKSPVAPAPPTGRIKQIIWNQAARNLGLEGVDVVKRYVSSPPSARGSAGRAVDAEGEGDREEEVVLSRAGRPLYPNSDPVESCWSPA
ncbi:hypothetical protein LTR84_002051 [Exophiala bonariae]|uniref:Required for respiratory growth protein 7, mitochondrial n=1 Tax=Exophiala bonariae TaxID=1690606 RepID=A0AAV9NCH3_9EURO|nr:hypothetical protein LTR84_002051 [Exophiala bonariae]